MDFFPVTRAAIIAGGASRRMGFNKALEPFDGQPVIARVADVLSPLFEEVVVVARDRKLETAAGVPAIPDTYPNKGPLGGIHAALCYFELPTFCVAADLPFLRADVINWLCENYSTGCDVLAPFVHEQMETLHAIYAPSCKQVLSAELQGPRVRSAHKVLSPLRICRAEEEGLRRFDSELKFLTNLNTPEDWKRASRAD